MIVSQQAFAWVVTAAALGLCIGWGARDAYLLSKHWKNRRDGGALVRDQVFGSIIGLVICAIGVVGVLKYHLGF